MVQPDGQATAGFELLEHTADIGVRARGATLEEAFEQATLGLAEVQGALAPRPYDDGVSVVRWPRDRATRCRSRWRPPTPAGCWSTG